MRSAVLSVAIWLGAAVAGGIAASPALAQNNVLFIFDASGSMKVAAGPESRMAVAKKAMGQALKEVPADVRLGLLMYGHRRANDCKDIELVSPIGADDAATINSRIQAVDAKGETPIADALRQAARSFAALKGQSNSIVLVTDGIEECNGDPCAAAREIKAAGLDLKAHVVGFALNDQQRKAVQCIPDITGGRYFEARDASGLTRALGEVRQQTVQAGPPSPPAPPAPPPRTDLLARNQGGEVVMSSHPIWEQTNDQKLGQIYWFAPGAEAVFGFKGGSAAKFDAFAVYLPQADASNVKDIELFAGDEGPTGAFRSLGVVSTVNAKMRDGWQEFKIPETTAKFLKVKFIGSHAGGQGYLYELRLYGQLAQAAAPAASAASAAPAAPRTDLLARNQGGEVVMSSHPIWEQTNDQKLGQIYWFAPGAEAVFGFKGGSAAKFDAFAVYLPQADASNVKDIELFAGDEGPTGSFRSLGVVSTVNAKMRDGWQEFKIPETTAKFLKVKFVGSHAGGQGYLYELRLYGQLAQAAAPAASAASAAPAAPRTDLLAPNQGGEVVMSSHPIWEQTNDQKLGQIYWFAPGAEAVFGFKGGSAAKFDTFAVYLPAADTRNVKELELFAGDEGPTGSFRSLGVVSTVNAKMRDGWQEFKIPETTAKFLKVKFIGSHAGGQGYLYELRLYGSVP